MSYEAASDSQEAGHVWLRRILWFLVACKVTLLIVYSAHARWVMDEFAQAYSSRYLAELYASVDPIKTALPLFAFRIPTLLFTSSIDILRSWRIETTIVALLTIVVTGVLASRLRRGAYVVPLSVFILLSFSNFFERSFRVRSDTFAVLFAVAALAASIQEDRDWRATWLPGGLVGVAFLCTQKSAYFVVGLLLLQAVAGASESGWRGATARCGRFLAGTTIPLLVYAAWFGGLHLDEVLTAVFVSPLQPELLTSQFHSGLEQFIYQTLARNLAVYVICGVGLGLALLRWRVQPPAVRGATVACTFVVVAIFNHPQPWPYVFVMALPLLAVWAPWPLELLSGQRRRYALVLVVVLLSLSFVRNLMVVTGPGRQQQFRTVRYAESLLGPDDRYFDGIAMIPTRSVAGPHPWWWWDAPTRIHLITAFRRGDYEHLNSILRDEPKLWITNYRFRPVARTLRPILDRSTVRVSRNILLAGCELRSGKEVHFENLWTGTFDLFDESGAELHDETTILLDGRICALPCRIPAGGHVISTSAGRRGLLLPADFIPIEGASLPYQGPAIDLFAGVY